MRGTGEQGEQGEQENRGTRGTGGKREEEEPEGPVEYRAFYKLLRNFLHFQQLSAF